MTDSTSNDHNAAWPLPKFRFEVDLGSHKKVVFREVSGMDVENQIIEYRSSSNPVFSPVKMPGLAKFNNVTLKKGVFVNDNTFWEWHAEIQMNTIKRTTVIIRLLDETGNVVMQWKLINAWPIKISSTDLKSEGNEVAIETLVIAHEGIEVLNKP